MNLFFNWDDEHKEWRNDLVHDKEYTAEYWEYNKSTNEFEKRHEYDVMQDYNCWVQHDLYTDTQEGWIESPKADSGNLKKNKAYAYYGNGQYDNATDAKKQKWAMIGDPYKFILYNYNRKAESGSKNSYYLRSNFLAGYEIENYNFSSFPRKKENTPGLFWTWKVDGTRFTFAEGDAQNSTTTYGPREGLPESFYQDYAAASAQAANDSVKKAGYSIETGYLALCDVDAKSLYDEGMLVGSVKGYVSYNHKYLITEKLTDKEESDPEGPLKYHKGTKDKFYIYNDDPNDNADRKINYTTDTTTVPP